MKIGIVGGGAIGQFLCASLTKKLDGQVILFTRTEEQARCIRTRGIVIENKGNMTVCPVLAQPIAEIGSVDILFFTVKQYALEAALATCVHSGHSFKTYVFLQNGMGHLEQIEKIPTGNIYVGTVSHGVTRRGMHEITLKGVGPIRLSALRGEDKIFESTMLQIHTDDFPIQMVDESLVLLREKLYINAVINPLTALLQVKNGKLKENSFFYQMAEKIFEELDLVFGFGDSKEVIWRTIVSVMEATAENESSMLQDLKNGRLTEIDGIYGYIMKEAKKRDKLLTIIPFVYQAIRGIEERGK